MSSTPAPVTLKPDVRLPLLVVALGLALLPLPLSPWPTLVVVLFGLFLLIQSASLRLEFNSTISTRFRDDIHAISCPPVAVVMPPVFLRPVRLEWRDGEHGS